MHRHEASVTMHAAAYTTHQHTHARTHHTHTHTHTTLTYIHIHTHTHTHTSHDAQEALKRKAATAQGRKLYVCVCVCVFVCGNGSGSQAVHLPIPFLPSLPISCSDIAHILLSLSKALAISVLLHNYFRNFCPSLALSRSLARTRAFFSCACVGTRGRGAR